MSKYLQGAIIIINERDFIDELNEFLKEEDRKLLDIQQDENNNYIINDKHQADYFIKLSKQCEEEIEDIQKYIEEEKQRFLENLQRFEAREIEKVRNRQQYYNRALEDYAVRELESSGKKSIKLPNGTLALKKQQPSYEYQEDILLTWAEKYYPDLVKTTIPEPKKSIDKKELKKRAFIDEGSLFIDGFEVQGVSVEQRDSKFEIKQVII